MKKVIITGNILFFLAWPLGGYFAAGLSRGQDAAGRGYTELMGYALAYLIFNPFIAIWPVLTEEKRKKLSKTYNYLAFLPFTVCSVAVLAGAIYVGILLLS